MKKTLMIVLVILLISTAFPTEAYAFHNTINCYGGIITITDDNTHDYFYVYAPTTFVQTGDLSSALPVSIIVNPGCHVTFSGEINLTGFESRESHLDDWTAHPTLQFWSGSTTLTIARGSNVKIEAKGDYSAIQVKNDCTLTINGEGDLDAEGHGGGAGIGGKEGDQSGSIIFDGSVNVIAQGGYSGGAGIGGGANGGSCKSITTKSTYTGTINATGGNDQAELIFDGGYVQVGSGAGIGGGSGGRVTANITLSGGNIVAKSGKAGGAAGIGSGAHANVDGWIIISGSCTVDAISESYYDSISLGAGVGAGYDGSISKILIADNADVTAIGGFGCPGIGGTGGAIEISGNATVDAIGGAYGAGIGGGRSADSPIINISGGSTTAEAGTYNIIGTSGAAIGGGTGGGTIPGGINISGGEVIAIPHLEGTGIGAGAYLAGGNSSVYDINISGDAVVYVGESSFNAIGSSTDLTQGIINLSGTVALFLQNTHSQTCPVNAPDFSHPTRADFAGNVNNGHMFGYKYICPQVPNAGYMKYLQISFYTRDEEPTAPTPMKMKAGGMITLPWADKSHNYNGYAVRSWYDWGSETEHAPGSEFTVTESDTLYVKWKWTLNEYTVTYLTDDNTTISGDMNQTVIHGQDATAVTVAAKSDCFFLNWSDGNVNATRQDENITRDTTYTSMGAMGTITLSFDGNEGDDTSLQNMPSSILCAEDIPFTLTANVPTRILNSFKYWEIAANQYNPGDTTTITENTTAVAKWDYKPSVRNDSASVDEGGTIQIDVLANDFDAVDPEQELTIGRIVTQSQHGTVQTVNGKIEYTHNGDSATNDVFYYKLNDPYGESYLDGKVTITITQTNDEPIVDNGIYNQTATEDTLFEFVIPSDAFSDEESSTLIYTIYDLPDFLSFDGTDTVSGTPLNADVGSHSVTVRATDEENLFAETSFVIIVENTNDAPVILDQTHDILENTGNGNYVTVITAHDNDVDDAIVFEILSGNEDGAFAMDTAIGEITVKDSSLLDFETNPKVEWTVQVTDESGLSSSALVTININDDNDKPLAKNNTLTIIENESYKLKKSDFNYSDEDGDALVLIRVLNQTTNGVLKLESEPIVANQVIALVDISDDKLEYHPNKDAYGIRMDFFEFRVNDGTDDSFDFYEITFDIIQAHQITYLDHDNSILGNEFVAHGSSASHPKEPVRDRYTFVAWTDGVSIYKKDLSDFPAPTNDCVLKAKYEANKYTLKFVDYDGSVIETLTMKYGANLTYPSAPNRRGYSFIGWGSYLANMPANNSTVITAKYRINIYTVTFLGQGGKVIESRSVVYRGKIEYPDNPEEGGYRFISWDSNITTMPSNDVTITSEWASEITSIHLEDFIKFTVGDKKDLIATIAPDDAIYQKVTWKSSNESVVSVDANGKVTAIGVGDAVITATVGGFSDSCEIIVSANVSDTGVSDPSPRPTATQENNILILPNVIVDEEAGTVTIEIPVEDLQEGATGIKLPNGEVIRLSESQEGILYITIDEDDLHSDGTFKIFVIDESDVAFGSIIAEIATDNNKNNVWLITVIGLIGLLLITTGIAMYIKQKRRSRLKMKRQR